MAQASVIIHTRTRLCDFPSTLAVCPSAIGGSDVEKVRKQILAATRSIDSMGQNEVRQMIYTCGNLVIAGMVSFLKNFSGNNAEDEKFFYDEKGRGIYAFVGFVFQARNQNAPFIDKKILWESFKSYMEPVWERTVLDTQSSDFKEIDLATAISKEPMNGESVSDMTLYTMGAEDASIFSYWLGQALKVKSVSFCSNVTDFKVVKDKPFNIITTTANIIERMKREPISTSSAQAQSTRSSLASNTTANISQKKNFNYTTASATLNWNDFRREIEQSLGAYINRSIRTDSNFLPLKIKSVNIPEQPRKRGFPHPQGKYCVTIELEMEEFDGY